MHQVVSEQQRYIYVAFIDGSK